jgi:hypothetical protein
MSHQAWQEIQNLFHHFDTYFFPFFLVGLGFQFRAFVSVCVWYWGLNTGTSP